VNSLEVLNQAATEMGIPVLTTGAGALDVQGRQLFGLYNSLGQTLITDFIWQKAQRHHEFVTVAGQEDYALPADFNGIIDQTHWDRTNHWNVFGQATPQQWAWLTGGVVTQGPRTSYRIRDNMFQIFPAGQADGWNISFEYLSKGWCYNPSAPNEFKALATTDQDVAIFTDRLMVAGVKLKFFEVKGFDTRAFQKDFDNAISAALGRDQGAPKLTLSPRPQSIYIGPQNIQDGNWGVT
jgi:hypothetical protein